MSTTVIFLLIYNKFSKYKNKIFFKINFKGTKGNKIENVKKLHTFLQTFKKYQVCFLNLLLLCIDW